MNYRIKDHIILGHNPLFGVDHLSQEQGNVKEANFEDQRLIAEVLKFSHSLGVHGMMMSTHPRARVVSDLIGQDKELASEWRIYPLVPYIQKYIRESNEKGMLNMILEILSQASMAQKFSLLLQGTKGFLTKDIQHALTLLIDIELLPFRGRQLGAIFLHDALTDLTLGLHIEPLLETFRDHVEKTYKVPAGFITKNVPLLRERTEKLGWSNLLAMASFNKMGFYVNPSLEAVAESIRKPGMEFVAMTTLSSGALSPHTAYEFLSSFPGIQSIVVGMSKKNHIEETVTAIKKHLKLGLSSSPK